MQGNFTFLDLGILIGYLGLTTFLGIWIARSGKLRLPTQQTTKDYFIGNKRIPWWAVSFSIVATETSSLTFISIPGLAYVGNFTFLQIALGFLLGRILIAYLLLPKYYAGEIMSVYEVLEVRFGKATRRFASATFMITRAFGDSVRIFATSIPIALLLAPMVRSLGATQAIEANVSTISILALGVATLLYTYFGGMKAVIWMDVIQTGVYMLGGVAALVLIGIHVPGGWPEVLSAGFAADKLRIFDLSLGFDKPQTLMAGLIGGAFLSMATHGVDQMMVQRLFSSSGLSAARKALIGSGVFVVFQFAVFLLIGTGLFHFYAGAAFERSDAVFPQFILEVMPPGLTGLIVAAILAAAMSTISSSLNSLSAAATFDFYKPLFKVDDDVRLMAVAKGFTIFWAFVLVGGALLYSDQKTPVVTLALSVASFTYGSLLGAFFLGNYAPSIKEVHLFGSMILAMTLMALIVFSAGLISAFPGTEFVLGRFVGIAWPWYVLIGSLLTVALAHLHLQLTEWWTPVS